MNALALLLAVAVAREPGAADEARSAWRYRRSVSGLAHEVCSLPLPPDLFTRARADGGDLRLVREDGSEIAFLLDRQVEREGVWSFPGQLVDLGAERELSSRVEVDLGEPRRFDTLELEVDGGDFAKRVRVDVSDDGERWTTARADAGVFERPWGGGRVRHTRIALREPARARRVRLTLDDAHSRPVTVRAVTASLSAALRGTRWERAAGLRLLGVAQGVARYAVDVPAGLPLGALQLDADDPVFSRKVKLLEEQTTGGRVQSRTLGEATLYRLRSEPALSGEALELTVSEAGAGSLVLEIEGRDSPPLANPRIRIAGPGVRLLFAPGEGPAWLYHGNGVTRAPSYDLEALRAGLVIGGVLPVCELGEEQANPRFVEPLPLQFAARPGSVLDPRGWRMLRRIDLPARDDLYTLTLAAADLGHLRPDLADLRIVDAEDRQVPFVSEPAVGEERVPLEVQAEASRPGTTRTRLTVSAGEGRRPLELPLGRLRLEFAEGFFSRPARVVAETASGRERELTLWSGKVERRGGGADGVDLLLPAGRWAKLWLVVEDGDDAPLTLSSAQGVVALPRVAFKARGGGLRLLLGNPQAEAARFDLASLRREVLAYSAVPVSAAALEVNTGHRRSASDLLRQAPPTLLLWGALLLGVLALLGLTARILGDPPAPGQDGGATGGTSE